MNLFKRSYAPYVMFLAGAVLIFLWARTKNEGFANPEPAAPAPAGKPYSFTMYYADWCPHCQHAKPEFAKLGAIQTIGGKSVHCEAIDAEKNPEKVKTKVSGYPTFHLYDAEGALVKEYNGERNSAAFQAFLESALN